MKSLKKRNLQQKAAEFVDKHFPLHDMKSFREIADELKISEDSARRAYDTGMRKLRKFFIQHPQWTDSMADYLDREPAEAHPEYRISSPENRPHA